MADVEVRILDMSNEEAKRAFLRALQELNQLRGELAEINIAQLEETEVAKWYRDLDVKATNLGLLASQVEVTGGS